MKKSVWFIASNPFNPDPRAEKQMKFLSNNGFRVSGIGWDRSNNNDSTFSVSNNVNVEEMVIKGAFGSGLKNLFPLVKFNIRLFFKLLKNNEKIDIIQSVNLDTGLTCLFFSKIFNKKMTYDIYDYYADAFPVPSIFKPLVKKIENFVIDKSDSVILPIDSRKAQIKGSHPKSLLTIYNTPDINATEVSNKYYKLYRRGKINISFVGSLTPNRFLDELIDISRRRNDIFLHIAGFGNEKIVDNIKDKRNGNVRFYGKVPYKDGLAISKMSDMMVAIYNPTITNHKYSAPNKFYESLLLGKPIVVAKGTGIDNLVDAYNVGYSIDYNENDFESLLNVLNYSKLEKFKKNNQKVYTDHFSWSMMEKRLLNQYRKL